MNQYRIGFVMEQALGHVTHAKNIQAHVIHDPSIRPHWCMVDWDVSGWGAWLPLYKNNWTVRAGLRARRGLAELRRLTDLDALFFHTQVPAVFAIDWLGRIPSVVSLDATPLQYDELGASYGHESGPAWLERFKWRQNHNCFRAARSLVAWSHWAKNGLIEGYAVEPEKVSIIPPGVDVCAWSRPPAERAAHEAVRILFVGGDLARKGGLFLLEAFRALRPLGAELHLVTRDHVEAEPGLFVYNDMQPNSAALRQLYWRCDVFCLPTLGDCLPMALAEAGAAGLPLVSTRVAAIPEIVRDGVTGLLTPRADEPALAEALRRLIADPALRERLGASAATLVARDFDAGRNTARLLDLLKQVADEAREAA